MTVRLPASHYPTRMATVAELDAVTLVADRLDRASDRGLDETTVSQAVPPGRLDLEQAMQADAQAQLGLPRTATPWQRKRRRTLRAPALRLGIAIDHSPSMHDMLDAAMGAAWVVEAAAARARQARSTVALATFDTSAHLIESGSTTHVPTLETAEPGAVNHSGALPEVLDLLRARLEMDHYPDDSRFLVIISDSVLQSPQRAAHAIQELHAAGVRLLWISIDEEAPGYLPDGVATLTADAQSLLEALPGAVTDALATAYGPGGYQ